MDEAVVRAMAQPVRESLAVATDFAFAAFCLMPRLERFYELHPQVDVSLVTSNRALVQLAADVDLAVVFGDGRVQRGASSLLLREKVFPVCSPGLLQSHDGDADRVLRDDMLESSLGYHLVLPRRKRRPAVVEAFARWLQSELPPLERPPLDSDHG
jgi:DNA-binding transcriptional LysR family regulator